MVDIEKRALKLLDLEKEIVKSILNWDVDSLAKYSCEFGDIKKELRNYLRENPIITNVRDQRAQEMLSLISRGGCLDIEERLEKGHISDILSGELSDDELEEMGFDQFYSWFSHIEYVRGMLEAGALILQKGEPPKILYHIIKEVRSCYVFQQYNAVCAMCRNMLDICLRDVCIYKKVLITNSENTFDMENYKKSLKTRELINSVASGDVKKNWHKLYDDLNPVIHGHIHVTQMDAKQFLLDTLKSIQDLYAQNYNFTN